MKERTGELRRRAGVGAFEPLPRVPPPTPEVIGFSEIRCTICGAARQAHEDGSAGACSALDCKDPLHDLRASDATYCACCNDKVNGALEYEGAAVCSIDCAFALADNVQEKIQEPCTDYAPLADYDDCTVTERQGAIDAFEKIMAMVEHDSPVHCVAAEQHAWLTSEAGQKRSDP